MVLLSGAKPEGFQIRLCVNLECRHLPGHFRGHALSAHVCDSITLEFIWFCNLSIEKQKATAHWKGILDVSLWLHPRSILKAIYPSNPICLNPPTSQTDHWLIFTQQLGLDLLHFQSSLGNRTHKMPSFISTLAFLFAVISQKAPKPFEGHTFPLAHVASPYVLGRRVSSLYTVKTLLEVCQKRRNQMESCHLYTNNLQLELGISEWIQIGPRDWRITVRDLQGLTILMIGKQPLSYPSVLDSCK